MRERERERGRGEKEREREESREGVSAIFNCRAHPAIKLYIFLSHAVFSRRDL